MLKLDENAVAAKQGNQGALLKIILRYLTSAEVEGMENEGKAIFEQILEYIIPQTKSIKKEKLSVVLALKNFSNP